MSVGKMRKRIKLQSKTTSNDGGGSAAVDTWTTFATVFGSIEPKSGQERFFGDQLQEPITHIIRLRYRSDLTFKNRLQYTYRNKDETNTRTFNIRRIISVDSRDKYLECLCVEGVAT
jgi:SPP1 family predicted phage head-tail adaptor